mmetsp:Transcript_13359/g.34046  ORF Transcript_13359/g.34046 Transcript_13359/m.34046 type:complete len:423 (+) Transcript_13359:120-1388(+)
MPLLCPPVQLISSRTTPSSASSSRSSRELLCGPSLRPGFERVEEALDESDFEEPSGAEELVDFETPRPETAEEAAGPTDVEEKELAAFTLQKKGYCSLQDDEEEADSNESEKPARKLFKKQAVAARLSAPKINKLSAGESPGRLRDSVPLRGMEVGKHASPVLLPHTVSKYASPVPFKPDLSPSFAANMSADVPKVHPLDLPSLCLQIKEEVFRGLELGNTTAALTAVQGMIHNLYEHEHVSRFREKVVPVLRLMAVYHTALRILAAMDGLHGSHQAARLSHLALCLTSLPLHPLHRLAALRLSLPCHRQAGHSWLAARAMMRLEKYGLLSLAASAQLPHLLSSVHHGKVKTVCTHIHPSATFAQGLSVDASALEVLQCCQHGVCPNCGSRARLKSGEHKPCPVCLKVDLQPCTDPRVLRMV